MHSSLLPNLFVTIYIRICVVYQRGACINYLSKYTPVNVLCPICIQLGDGVWKSTVILLQGREHQRERDERLLSLEREGQMFQCMSSDAAATWDQALMELSDVHRKFAINSAVDTLPHNANLHLWPKRNDVCPLCGNRQTLIHVLNACPVALQARRYNHRHDTVLRKIFVVF